MTCHGNAAAAERAPDPSVIRQLPPEKIYEALTTGAMKTQGQSLTDEERRMVALFMSGWPIGSSQSGDARGGSMSAPGPTVAGGMLFVGSGYGVLGAVHPGNALLAFSVL